MNKKTQLFYHGSPCSIEAFDYAFTGRGTDQHGSGFYFASTRAGAAGYTDPNDVVKAAGAVINPTLHTVKLDIKNPLDADHYQRVTVDQVIRIIRASPVLEDKMWDMYDVGTYGLEACIHKAARLYAILDTKLLDVLNRLSGDIFDDDSIKEFNEVVRDVLGYDGVKYEVKQETIMVAWFPEQIEIVKRTPIKKLQKDDEPDFCP